MAGAGNLLASTESIPFIFDSSLVTNTPNEVSVTIRQKTAEELGINASEDSVLNAVLNAADADDLMPEYSWASMTARVCRQPCSRCFQITPAARLKQRRGVRG